jgi:hypothetical protein
MHVQRIAGALLATALVAGGFLGLTAGSGAAGGSAKVTIVHGIPSVGPVDVCADGSTVLVSDVSFKGVATIDVPAGTYDLTVKAHAATPCTGAVAITLDGATIPAGANLSVVAALTGGSPKLDVFENDIDPVAAGSGRVAVYHAANAPAVDVLVNGNPGLSDIAPGATRSADLPTAAYDFGVVAAGTTSPVLLDLPGVTVPAGTLLQVFAVGQPGNADEPFQVITHALGLSVTAASTTTVAPTTTMAPAAPINSSPALTG